MMYRARLTCLGRYGSIAKPSAKDLLHLHPTSSPVPLTTAVIRPLSLSSRRGIATDSTSGNNGISAEHLYDFGVKHVTKGLGRITEGIMTKGEGSYVVYDDGRRMLDFTCGIGVTSLGKVDLRFSGEGREGGARLKVSTYDPSL